MTNNVVILGVSGSSRKGATHKALDICLEAAKEVKGVEIRRIDLAGKLINTCRGCNACFGRDPAGCPVFRDDFDSDWLEMYDTCDAIILASPIYSMNPTGLLNSFMSRMRASGQTRVQRAARGMRIGGSIAVGGRRNGGQDLTLATLNAMMQSGGTNVVGGGTLFYNGAAVWSQNERDFQDQTGILELEVLGRKVAYATKIVQAGLKALSDELSPANLMGAHSLESLAEHYRQLGL